MDGFRILCLHPDLPPEEVYGYLPLGEYDASGCMGFDEGEPVNFWNTGDLNIWNTCEDHNCIRKWCEERVKSSQ